MKNIKPPIKNDKCTTWGYMITLPYCAFETPDISMMYVSYHHKRLHKFSSHLSISSCLIFDLIRKKDMHEEYSSSDT